MELFIHPAQPLPDVPASHQEGAGRLLDWPGLLEIATHVSVISIDRIGRPQPVDAQDLEGQGQRGRKTPDREPSLRLAVFRDQLSGRQSVHSGSLDDRFHRIEQNRIGIQQKQKVRWSGGTHALIDGSGKAFILRIFEEFDASAAIPCEFSDARDGVVPGRVIDDEDLSAGSHLGDRVEARLDLRTGVVGYHYRRDRQK